MVSLSVALLCMGFLVAASMDPNQPMLNKVNMIARGPVQMLFSTETALKAPLSRLPDPDLLKGWPTNKTTVFFIRHGESYWNQVFNQGKGFNRWAWIPFRLGHALIEEAKRLVSPSSVFVDSPLSETGFLQALAIRQDLELSEAASKDKAKLRDPTERRQQELWGILRGEGQGPVTVACSNLIRAAETALIGLPEALIDPDSEHQKLHCLTLLQEFSRNIDALSLSPPGHPPHCRPLPSLEGSMLLPPPESFDCAGNTGNKPLRYNPIARLCGFAEWAFMHSKTADAAVVAVGHSLWFRTFFQAFLPHAAQHQAKQRKMTNAAVVAFTLERGVIGGKTLYRIEPDSIVLLRGAFRG
mmetsp:Transcript_52080/g.122191  ORF Transcript_52080/g.122191 Transcript_52080/m.122191 type:complete len:356 (-) Transcript_52080:8-1075(-)